MAKIKFDLSHPSAIAGLWFLGLAFGCFTAYLTFTIMGNTTDLAWLAVQNLTAALVYVIVGSIMMILGLLSLFLNTKRAAEGSGDEENALKVLLLLVALSFVFIIVLIITGAAFSL